MDKQLEKELKNQIRRRGTRKWFYKLDTLLKITKIKILKYNLQEQYEDKKLFRVKYTEKFNMLNPCVWLIFIYFLVYSILKEMIVVTTEIYEEMGCTHQYNDTFTIHQK